MGMDIKKVGTIAYMAVMVFYGVYTMVLAIQAYTKFSDTTQNYLNLANNLGMQFVSDVQVSTTSCPSGYSTIFDWNWEGSNAGCDCTTSTYTSTHKSVYTGACNTTEISRSCKTLTAVSSVSFNAIEGATNSKQLVCVKRSSKRFSDIAAQQTGTCTSSQKTCGNTGSKGTVICVGLSESCPIYSIRMSATVDTTTYPSNEWTQISLASGSYLYVNYNGLTRTALPTSEYRFTQKGVCKLYNYQKVLPTSASDYLLVKTQRDSCSDLDSSFYLTNLQVAENKYYSLNVPSTDWTKMQAWPNYAVPTSTELFKSYERPFINWKVTERDQVKDVVDSANSMGTLKTAQLVTMVINIIVCIAVSIVLQFSQVYNLCGKDVPCISGSGDEEQKRIVFIKKILTYGSKLLQAPFLLWAFIISAQKKGILNNAANSSPSDDRFNQELKYFATQLEDDVYQKNLIALIILLVTVLLDIVLWLKGKYCTKKPADNQVEPAKQDEEQHIKQQNMSATQTPHNNNSFAYNQQEMQQYPQQSQYAAQPYGAQQQQFQQTATTTYNPQFQQPVYVQPVMVQQPVVIVAQPQPQPVVVYQQF